MTDPTIYATTSTFTSGVALIDSQNVASWIYIIVAIVSVILGIITLVYNTYNAYKDDKKIDETEREELINEIDSLKKQLDDINKNRP